MDVRTETEDQRETRIAYDRYADFFTEKFQRAFEENTIPFANRFLQLLPGKSFVVDLGSGPGYHGAYFRDHGHDVLCVDISEGMLAQCRARGLPTLQANLEEVTLPRPADAIWAYTCLLHVPRSRVPRAIENIRRNLRPGGLLEVCIQEGTTEGYKTQPELPGIQRWFTYFTDTEIQSLFSGGFDLLKTDARQPNTARFLHYLFRRT